MLDPYNTTRIIPKAWQMHTTLADQVNANLLALMGLRLPDLSGIDAMIAIRAEFPEARIIHTDVPGLSMRAPSPRV